jgi:hypothetical protein
MQEPDEEDAKSVDDELAGAERVDVRGDQVSLTQPLRVLHIDVRLAVIRSWKTTTHLASLHTGIINYTFTIPS